MNLLKSIKNQVCFDYRLDQESDSYNIGFGIDKNFIRCAGTSIASFCLNNESHNFQFHVVIDSISLDNKNKFKKLAQKFHISITIYEIDASFLETFNFPTNNYWPLPIYFRFILPKLLPSVSKILYVDADIVCLNNITPLFKTNLSNHIIAAVAEPLEDVVKERCAILKLSKNNYFNSGMLLIDIQKWNQLNLSEQLIKTITENRALFTYVDQDALNVILQDDVKYIDSTFNYLLLYNQENTISLEKDNITLLHFAATPKPWHLAWNVSPSCNIFTKDIYHNYEQSTPWKNEALVKPTYYKDIRRYAKYLRVHHFYLKSLYWYIKYSISKLKYHLK